MDRRLLMAAASLAAMSMDVTKRDVREIDSGGRYEPTRTPIAWSMSKDERDEINRASDAERKRKKAQRQARKKNRK